MNTITIIDYGMGNLASVYNAFVKVGAKSVQISSDPAVIAASDKLVLPGVGAFPDAMKNLQVQGLVEPIRRFAASGKPLMGICLGMHLMFERGMENGVTEGLGILPGEVVRFKIDLPVPHMGWNDTAIVKKTGVFDNMAEKAYFYFDHSYYPVLKDVTMTACETDYGIRFASAVVKGNVSAIQFHPEKSHDKGLKIIENFVKMQS